METATTMAVISIVAVGMVTISDYVLNKQQHDITVEHLNELRRAVSGNPVIVVNEARTSFGYLGDMGKLPTSLQDLWVKGSQPAFTFNTTKKAGAGWNGPYLNIGSTEFAGDLASDGWGNTFSYTTTAFLDGSFGATALGRLASLGRDFTNNTADDVAINFFESEVASRVQGYVKDTDDNIVSGVGLTLNYPVNGVLSQHVIYTDSTGYYSVSNVPYGNRSITIEPKLVLAPTSVIVSGNNNQHVKFTVKNYAADDLSVTSMTVAYTVEPNAWFGQVRVDGSNVYNTTTPRFGTLDTTTFSAETVIGTDVAAESIPIRLQSPVTDVADLIIGDVGKGGSLIVELRDFYSVESGSGGEDVDLTGVSFEVTFKNVLNEVMGVVVVQP